VSDLLDGILGLDPVLILALTGLLVFAEDAIFVGFVIPGETAAVLAGVGAGLGEVALPLSILVVVLAAIIGDSVGYEVGWLFFGPRVLTSRFLAPHRHRIERAQAFLRRRGGIAVFLGRFTAFFRAVMPALAGIAHMPYRRFLVFNLAGGLFWGIGVVLLGYLAGNSYEAVERVAGRAAAIVVVVLVVAGLVAWHLRRRRRERQSAEL
jgi:membrane-associated protein